MTASAALSQAPSAQLPFLAADPSDSPRLAILKRAIDAGNSASAVAQFWNEVRRDGTPLIEPIPGGPQYSSLTFLWQAKRKDRQRGCDRWCGPRVHRLSRTPLVTRGQFSVDEFAHSHSA
jgi:hypothetical protein